MSSFSFREFIKAYNDGRIQEDATWRAYDIERMAQRSTIVRKCVKVLGYTWYGDSLTFENIARDYDLATPARARQLATLWWAWARIALGEARHGLILRSDNNA